MKILFLTLVPFKDIYRRSIYADLVRELANRGVEVYVVCPRQRREQLSTELINYGNIHILHVKTGNITNTKSFIEKGISTIRIEGQYLRAIKQHFADVKFNLVMYSTPPITFNKVLKYLKNRYNVQTYLMLKDIFPQNAVDIGLIHRNGLLRRYFKNKEIKLYKNSDVIGGMSQGNVDYILTNNPYLENNKVEIFPNSIKPIERKKEKVKNVEILNKYGIPKDKTLFIYGGNLGKPQGIDFLIEVTGNFVNVKNGHLLIVGNGTEYKKIERYLKTYKPANVSLFKKLPKDEYDKLVDSADVGLIFLDKRFTIPNIPSRLTSYMENSLPILAATDPNTDLKNILEESKSGFWCESGNLSDFTAASEKLANNTLLREKMGNNGRDYLEKYFDVTNTVGILLKHMYKE